MSPSLGPSVRHTSRHHLRRTVAGSALALLVLTGCGVGDDTLSPGLAAQVGDTSIKLDRVDDAASDICDMITVLSQDGTASAVPGSVVRDNSLQYVVLRELGNQLGDAYDVRAGAAYRSALETNQTQLAGFGVDSQLLRGVVPILSSGDYFLDIVQQIGRADLGLTTEAAGQQEGIANGLEIAQQWVADHGLKVNPRFSSMSIGGLDSIVTSDVDDLSVPVSDFAQQALAAVDPADPNTSYADSLPESQRCG